MTSESARTGDGAPGVVEDCGRRTPDRVRTGGLDVLLGTAPACPHRRNRAAVQPARRDADVGARPGGARGDRVRGRHGGEPDAAAPGSGVATPCGRSSPCPTWRRCCSSSALAPAVYAAGVIADRVDDRPVRVLVRRTGSPRTCRCRSALSPAGASGCGSSRSSGSRSGWHGWRPRPLGTAGDLAGSPRCRRRSRTRYDDMVNGLDAMVWEAPGPTGDADYVSGRVTDLLGFAPGGVRATFAFLAEPRPSRGPRRGHREPSTPRRGRGHRGPVPHPRRLGPPAAPPRTGAGSSSTTTAGSGAGGGSSWTRRPGGRRRARRGATSTSSRASRSRSTILRLDDLEDPTSLRVVVGNPAAGDARRVDQPTRPSASGWSTWFPRATPMLDRLADVVRLGIALERPAITIGRRSEVVHALRAMPLPDQCVGIALEDVTKRARLAESLRHQALHDHLTGLPNRAQLSQRLTAALDRGRGRRHRTGLLLMDLNQFKDVNDSLGHEYGDRLLDRAGATALARHAQLRHHRPAGRRRVRDPAHRRRATRAPPWRSPTGWSSCAWSPSPSASSGSRSAPASVWPSPPTTRPTPRTCCVGPTPRCTGPRRPAAGSSPTPTAATPGAIDQDRPARRADRGGRVRRARRALPTPRVAGDAWNPSGSEALVRWRHPERGLLPRQRSSSSPRSRARSRC